MDTVSVKDLPEPIARAIEAMVQTLVKQLNAPPETRAPAKFPTRKGTVIGHLTRDEIYDDRV